MNSPPLLTGSALIFWGWQTGFLAISIVIALLFELPRLTSMSLDVTKEHLAKLWKLSSIIFMATAATAFMRFKSVESFLIFTTWLPLIFLPLTLPLAYKEDGKVDLNIFFVLLTKISFMKNRAVTLSYPYLIICIVASSAANVRHIGFYVGLVILSAWALFPFRSKGYTPAFWMFLIFFGAASGYGGAVGLNRLQGIMENAFIDWYVGSGRQDFDASRTKTAMGDMTELKLSNRIIMRVNGNSPRAIDYRLGKTAYNRYKSSSWQAVESPLLPLAPGHDNNWALTQGAATGNEVTISASSYGGETLLALPARALIISSIPEAAFSKSRLGAVSVKDGPAVLGYRVTLGREAYAGGEPDDYDLIVPAEEKAALSKVANQLDLQSRQPKDIINTVDIFFKNSFEYSLDLEGLKTAHTSLSDFLLSTRSGHCEYFATATALLLRQAGIPARYNVGYVYDEFSQLEDMFIVRDRNAHAWVTAYVDGKWRLVDTTPSTWQEVDKNSASFWEPLTDTWSALSFLFSKWQKEGGSIINNRYSMTAILLLVIILLRNVRKGKQLVKGETKEEESPRPTLPGEESSFYLIEKALTSQEVSRQDGETYLRWVKRLEREGTLPFPNDTIQSLLTLHMRWRFDPQGISDHEKTELESGVALLLGNGMG